MKSILLFVVAVFFITGCASVNQRVPEPPTAVKSNNPNARTIAADAAEQQFNQYFNEGNYFIKLRKLSDVTKQLHAAMPDKGSAKKRLVNQFMKDLNRIVAALAQDKVSAAERATTWIPAMGANRAEKIHMMGQVVQSLNVMDRMGIYLTASGVIDPDSALEDYYYTFISRAVYNIDSELRNQMLLYPPEVKDANENNAKLAYAKTLANDIRIALRHNFQSNKVLDIKRMDRALLQIYGVQGVQQAKQLSANAEYKYLASSMSGLHISNSSDIAGFDDEVETTLSTKFSFEMINQLVTSLR